MGLRDVTPDEVHARIVRGEAIDLIDVRTTMEWNGGHAVGARHVPLSGLDPAAVVQQRVGKPEDPIYVICASGARSASACEAFHGAGFTQAVNVAGGTSAWKRAGLPMERAPGSASRGMIREAAIMLVVAAVLLVLMPCSPLTIWGSAYCPITPSAPPASATTAVGGVAPVPTALDFNRDVVLASATQPVLIDFHASWCPPCKRLAPELAALASERGDRLRMVQIDVDQHGPLAQSQGVSSIPDVRLWLGGKEIARFAGFRTQAEVAAWIDQAIAAK
jgi:thioredoxin 1